MTYPPQIRKSKKGRSSHQRRINKKERRAKIRLKEEFGQCNPETGQRYRSPFVDLPTFHGATYFPIDIMHNLGSNIGHQLWNIMRGIYGTETSFYLNSGTRDQVAKQMIASHCMTPKSFAGVCGDINRQAGHFRSVDWIHFVRFLVPTIVLEHIHCSSAQTALLSLVAVYDLAFRRRVNKTDCKQLKDAVVIWRNFLHKEVKSKKLTSNVFTMNQHYLTHLHYIMRYLGPLPLYAAFSMERTIGLVKDQIGSKCDPGKNASNTIVDIAAIRYFKRMIRNESDDEASRPKQVLTISNATNSPELWGPGIRPFSLERMEKNAIRDYWRWVHGDKTLQLSINDTVKLASRLWICKENL